MKPDVDAIKTIREALRWVQTEREGDAAHCALDALEAELNAADLSLAAMLQDIGKRDDLIGELRARNDGMADRLGWARRLAPADSTPGDEELREAIVYFAALSDIRYWGQSSYQGRRALKRVVAAASAHIRSQQPETEEQRAERLLGEWLVAHPGWTHEWYVVPKTGELGPPFALALNHRPGQSPRRERERRGVGATKAVAILDALAKARDAEGGK